MVCGEGADDGRILLFSVVIGVDTVLRFVYRNFLESAYMFR
jgi:hypothetical protein